MLLKKLKLTDFRNYSEFEEDFKELKIIIIGQNAQGKSNILEAINLLATSKSERAERDSDLIHWGKDFALIFADIERKDGSSKIALQINSSGRRKLKINDVAKKAPQADLLGNFFAVMFSCDDLYLIKGSPSIRRSWLDSVLFQLDSKYHRSLHDYQKSISQKNALLKSGRENPIARKELKIQTEIWNEQIINSGTEIIYTRLEFLKEISPYSSELLKNISMRTEDLGLKYLCTINKNEMEIPNEKTNIKSLFKASLENSFEEECARGQSVIGPHRDDLQFQLNGREARSFASQGQQRSIILSLKLGEVQVIEKRKNEMPVLLLDDVFAELDEKRQDFLLHNLPENIQIFLTTTHISDVQKEFIKGAHIIEIKTGKIVHKVSA